MYPTFGGEMEKILLVAATADTQNISQCLSHVLNGSQALWLVTHEEIVRAVTDDIRKTLHRIHDSLARCERDQIPGYLKALRHQPLENVVIVIQKEDMMGMVVKLMSDLTLTLSEAPPFPEPPFIIDPASRRISSLAA